MNADMANKLGAYFSREPWCDKMGGLVKIIKYQSQDRNNNPIITTLPVGCRTDFSQCKNKGYTDLLPDNRYRSLFYFEDGGITLQKRNGDKTEFISRLKLVGWLNMKKFIIPSGACSISGKVISQILRVIPNQFVNFGIYTEARFKFISEDIKSPAIFQRYSMPEEVMQYLLYPYDYFALNFQVEFVVNRNCPDDLVLTDDANCNDSQ